MISTWPVTHGTYVAEKDGYVLTRDGDHWNSIFEAYKDSVEKTLGIIDLQKSDITDIILKPFKVSRFNKTDKSYHVDCIVEVKCTQVVTATFNVKDVNDDDYVQVKAENYRSGSQVNFPSYSPEKAGYKFSGWYFDRNLSKKVEDNYTIGNENVDFYAKYTPKTYTVTFDSKGGSSVNPQNVNHGAKANEPSVPTREGYKFQGWYTSEDATASVYDFDTAVTQDITLYAKWEQTAPPTTGTYALKIKYVYENGTQAANSYTAQLNQNAAYKVDSPSISGYVASMATVEGMMPAASKEVTVTYYLDNWKDADNTTGEQDKDSETGGDGIPDCDQVLIKYVSSNSDRGTVSPDMEVLTLRKDNKNVEIKINGSKATDNGGRNYFSNWTDEVNKQTINNATLTAETIKKAIETAKGGETYTFTANFERSSGGGSGGSNRPKPPVVEIPDDVPTGLNGKDHYAYIIGYGNNDVRPQNNITRAEVATIFFRLLTDETRTANMTKSNGYNDVKDGDWFCCAVSTLSKMGIIKGYEDGSFKPNDPISRAEFAAIAARFDPNGDKTPASFSDVTSHWAKDEISIAANHGWIKGYEDGSFKPDQKITRAETMTLVNRVLNRLPEAKDDLHKDMKTWVDNMDETAWYYLAVQEATNSHYFKNKTGTKFEQWTDLRDTRDWSELEK